MSKIIIIAWNFTEQTPDSCYEEIIFSDYKIIKYFTPAKRNNQIEDRCFIFLKGFVSETRKNVFVFIHSLQFDDIQKRDLNTFNNYSNNIYIEPFTGGNHYVYEKLIEEQNGNRTLRPNLNINSVKAIFEELEIKYGKMVTLEAKLIINKFMLIYLREKGETTTQAEAYAYVNEKLKMIISGFDLNNTSGNEKWIEDWKKFGSNANGTLDNTTIEKLNKELFAKDYA